MNDMTKLIVTVLTSAAGGALLAEGVRRTDSLGSKGTPQGTPQAAPLPPAATPAPVPVAAPAPTQ